MGESARNRMTAEEFLAWHEGRDDKWELVGGEPVRMMTGATRRHDQVVVNAIIQLGTQLRGKSCRPATDDTAVLTRRGSNVRRPDVTVECGELIDKELKANDPRMVIEVLSPSTRAFDQTLKLEEYKSVDSLRYILFLDTEKPRAKLFHRSDAGNWADLDVIGLDSVVDLPQIDVSLALEELYDGLDWPEDDIAT